MKTILRIVNCQRDLIKSKQFAIAASVLILLGIGTSISYASAETRTMYVENIPQHWQERFGGILANATQYWENKTPSLKFETTQSVDKADFVVEWASQYGEGKLGYYSADTENAYGKPTVAITLGFFKDREWQLASPEQVLQITKHELGHAIGLPYSIDPDDIMYPTIEDYESWQQDQASAQTSGTVDWEVRAEKYQVLASEKIQPLAFGLDSAQSSLNSASYNMPNESMSNAWTSFWWAKKYLNSAEKAQTDGGALLLQSNHHDAYVKFKASYDYAKKTEQKIAEVAEYIEKANSSHN